jgi:hypothetical protein
VSTTDLVVAFIEIMSANYPNFTGECSNCMCSETLCRSFDQVSSYMFVSAQKRANEGDNNGFSVDLRSIRFSTKVLLSEAYS